MLRGRATVLGGDLIDLIDLIDGDADSLRAIGRYRAARFTIGLGYGGCLVDFLPWVEGQHVDFYLQPEGSWLAGFF